MEITASTVKELREKTGVGMMDCKKALEETNGDFEAAIKYLREKGLSAAAKKADREAKEGRVFAVINAEGTRGVIAEVTCETDFVANNTDFIAFGNRIAQLANDLKLATEKSTSTVSPIAICRKSAHRRMLSPHMLHN